MHSAKNRFLIAHPLSGRSGTQVLYIWARSEAEIRERLPQAEIWEPEPDWLTEDMKQRIGTREHDIDEPFDIHTLTHPPDMVFDRNDPPAGAKIIRDPDALEKARDMFREGN